MVKKKKQDINLLKTKSPSIFRSIPERAFAYIIEKKLYFFVSFITILMLAIVIGLSFELAHSLDIQKQVKAQREKAVYELTFWEKITKTHPDYRDGYFELALSEHRFGEDEKARENLQKAMKIDPNFEKGKELEYILGMK